MERDCGPLPPARHGAGEVLGDHHVITHKTVRFPHRTHVLVCLDDPILFIGGDLVRPHGKEVVRDEYPILVVRVKIPDVTVRFVRYRLAYTRCRVKSKV
jgi:hypothetical protein